MVKIGGGNQAEVPGDKKEQKSQKSTPRQTPRSSPRQQTRKSPKPPKDALRWLIKNAKSTYRRDLPKCPDCGNKKWTVTKSKITCTLCGFDTENNPTPSWILILTAEEWFAKIN